MAAELQIGGQGLLGIAFEATLGTYLAPTKWIRIRNESLHVVENNLYRHNIRGIADREAGPRGNFHIEGDIEFEVTADVLPYFLYAARTVPAKADTAGVAPYTYTFTPAHATKATTGAAATVRKTLSVLAARANEGFGYSGLSVVGFSFSFDDEVLLCTATMLGLSEATQTIPAASFDAADPYGPEHSGVKIPSSGSVRTDVASLNISIDDGGEPRHRIDGTRNPSGIRWGEREVTVSAEHDFESRADYDAFLAATKQIIELTSSRDAADDQVKVTLNGTIADTYATNLSAIGDLVMGSVEYHGTYDAGDVYEIEVKTTENIGT